MLKIRFFMVVNLLLFCLPLQASEAVIGLDKLPRLANMQQAGLLLLNAQSQPLIAKQASQLLVPASTTKLVTAYLTLSHWGEQHRFKTDFYLQRDAGKNVLWVKGYGDPFLISEELARVATELKQRLQQLEVQRIDVIKLDTSWFEAGLTLPGTSESDNPYDAVPSAIAANFNTLNLVKRQGEVLSAEPQTPVTPLARELGKTLTNQEQRINTGADARVSQRYFAELLAEFLRQQAVPVAAEIQWQHLDSRASMLYQHKNSVSLAQMIRPMMKYSTNFIANQLVLMMAAELYGAPVSAAKVKRLFREQLAQHFNWSGALLEEGAGLSRDNRLSPQQLIEVLHAFKTWKHLLPEVESAVYAKSGSLIGVSTLAGYIKSGEQWLPFALMMNEKTPYRYRNQVARQLRDQLNGR